MDKLKAYPFPMSPIEEQKEFAFFVSRIDKVKLTLEIVFDKLEQMKQTMIKKYFSEVGEND